MMMMMMMQVRTYLDPWGSVRHPRRFPANAHPIDPHHLSDLSRESESPPLHRSSVPRPLPLRYQHLHHPTRRYQFGLPYPCLVGQELFAFHHRRHQSKWTMRARYLHLAQWPMCRGETSPLVEERSLIPRALTMGLPLSLGQVLPRHRRQTLRAPLRLIPFECDAPDHLQSRRLFYGSVG